MTRISRASLITITAALALGVHTPSARAAETVVQVPLTGLLEGRSVTTYNNGVFTPWTLTTDGGGLQNGFMTAAGATKLGKPTTTALPDDGHFPADMHHPDVVLNFSNAAPATAPQTHFVPVSGTFKFAVPAAAYSKFFLFFNGADNGTTVKVTYTYSDATTEVHNGMIPDYYADITPTAQNMIFNLAPDLAKYSNMNAQTEMAHHHITGIEMDPTTPTKTLTGVQVDRGPNGYLVFWGATGIATSDVAGAGGSGGAAGAGGTSGAASAAGAGGASAGAPSTAGSAGSLSIAGAGGALIAGGASGAPATGAGGASAGTGGSPGASAGSSPLPNNAASDSGGCSMTAATQRTPRALWLVLGALGAYGIGRRRRRA